MTLAACGGYVELDKLLLEHGANIEEVNDEGQAEKPQGRHPQAGRHPDRQGRHNVYHRVLWTQS